MRRIVARFAVLVAALALAIGLTGCASTPPPGVTGKGTVIGIQETMEASQTGALVGAIGGALIGSALGSAIGDGVGRTVAATVGGVGGSIVAGSAGAKAGQKMVWVVGVRFDDGIDRTVKVTERPTFRPGDKVRVDNGVISKL